MRAVWLDGDSAKSLYWFRLALISRIFTFPGERGYMLVQRHFLLQSIAVDILERPHT